MSCFATGRRVCDATENLVVFGRPARFLAKRRTAELSRGAARYARSHAEEENYAWASLILGRPLLGQRHARRPTPADARTEGGANAS